MFILRILFYSALLLEHCALAANKEIPLEATPPAFVAQLEAHFSLSPVDMHNQALKFLLSEQETLAVILLRRNLYQNLFFPSYLSLKSQKEEVTLLPFLWQIFSLFFALLSLLVLFLSLKKALNQKRSLKMIISWFCGLTILFVSGFLSLKERGTNWQDVTILHAPFEGALSIGTIQKGSDLILIKSQGTWLQVKNSQKQRGWILKSQIIKTLE